MKNTYQQMAPKTEMMMQADAMKRNPKTKRK